MVISACVYKVPNEEKTYTKTFMSIRLRISLICGTSVNDSPLWSTLPWWDYNLIWSYIWPQCLYCTQDFPKNYVKGQMNEFFWTATAR